MTWKIKEKDKKFIVFNEGQGSFTFNNRFDAERLCEKLNMFSNHYVKVSDELIRQGDALIEFGNCMKKMGDM